MPGLGPKRVKTLYEEGNIQTLEQLRSAARNGQISHFPGFGRRIEQRILEAVRAKLSKAARFRIAVAAQVLEPLIKHLKAVTEAKRVEVAGAFVVDRKRWATWRFWSAHRNRRRWCNSSSGLRMSLKSARKASRGPAWCCARVCRWICRLSQMSVSQLDLVIGAVHSKFNLSRARQTERILRAMDHACFTLLAHPTGRMILEREPYGVDMSRIIRHAKQRGCFLELNAQPERLDLNDTYCMQAKQEGVLISVNSDAHSVIDFDNLHFGIGQARRGWLEKKDVLNTRTLAELKPILSRTRRSSR